MGPLWRMAMLSMAQHHGLGASSLPLRRWSHHVGCLRGMPRGSEALQCKSSTAHCPQAERQCIVGVQLPSAPKQCSDALKESHCPPSPGQ